MKKNILLLILIAFFISIFPFSLANAAEVKTIRVGYPIQRGLSEIGEDGNYYGYTYDYLQELAQYVGWNFEFVTVDDPDINQQLIQLLDMLEKGEIDMMGGMIKNDALMEMYDYPNEHYGMAWAVLMALEDNNEVDENNIRSLDGKRVGVVETAAGRNEELKSFCTANRIEMELVACKASEIEESLLTGKADVILGVDVGMPEGVRAVSRFGGEPYYFAVAKNKGDTVSELNSAILKLNQTQPDFMMKLYNKYFMADNQQLILTAAEQEYIQNMAPFRMGVLRNQEPFQYFDQSGNATGIAIDIMEKICEVTGIKVEYVPVDKIEDIVGAFNSNQIDGVCGIPYDYDWAKDCNIILTRPFADVNIMLVSDLSVNLVGNREEYMVAIPLDLQEPPNILEENVIWTDNARECLQMIRSGQAQYGCINSYAVETLLRQEPFHNMKSFLQTDLTRKYCYGMQRNFDITFLTIFNKALMSISDEVKQDIVFQNIASHSMVLSLSDIIDNNPQLVMTCLSVVLCLLLVAFAIVMYIKSKTARMLVIENERFHQLSELSNEFLFEYDFKKDCLTFTDKCAGAFGIKNMYTNYKTAMQRNFLLPEECDKPYTVLADVKDTTIDKECRYAMKDGTVRWFRVLGTVIKDSEENSRYFIGKLLDIQKEKEERDALIAKTQMDGLTNIYNAAASRQLISNMFTKEKSNTTKALLIIDFDHFKNVNDTFGHRTGDFLLCNLSRALEETFRKNDIIGRLGGDEFVVFMDNVSLEVVQRRCSELVQKMHMTMERDGKVLKLSVSIGGVVASKYVCFDNAYEMADSALYEVKKNTRDGFVLKTIG